MVPRIPDIELPPLPASGHRGRRTPKEPAGRTKGSSSGPWTWIVILLLGAAGGYLGGLSSRGLTGSTEGLAGSAPPAPAGATDTVRAGSSISSEPSGVGGAGVAARMEYLQGDGQAAQQGTTLPGRFGVQVVDANGQPVHGVEVRFQVVAGGGLVTPALALTDSLGRATAGWQLGPGPGFHRLTATSQDIETVVTFTAMARSTDVVTEALDPEDLPIRDVALPLPSAPETAIDAPPPTALAEFVSVVPRDMVVGGSTVCKVTGGGVTCRGASDRGQRIENEAHGTRALTAGLFHAYLWDGPGWSGLLLGLEPRGTGR